MQVELSDIIEYLGEPRTKIGKELIWQCPHCLDKSQDNLHYNPDKKILWCFCNEQHNKDILSEIMKKKHENKKAENKEIPAYIKNQEKYLMYQILCNDALLGRLDKSLLDELNKQDMFEKGEYKFYLDLIETDKPRLAREYLEKENEALSEALNKIIKGDTNGTNP